MHFNTVEENIKDVIETMRYYIQRDGGDLQFISYKDNIVTIKIFGACVGCNMIDNTYKNGIEAILKNEIKEIKGIVLIENTNSFNNNLSNIDPDN